MPRISVVIPTMNEEATIGALLDGIRKHLAHEDIEILIVDTNSRDRTREIAMSKGAIVVDEPRRGYGRAYKTGFERASGEIIVTMDADNTYPPEDISKLLALIDGDRADFATGDRLSTVSRDAMSTMHRFGNKLLNFLALALFFHRFRDTQTGMWVFRKKVLEGISPKSDGMPFSEEIKINAVVSGLRFVEVPITYRVRLGEVKLRSWDDGWKNIRYLFQLRFSGK
jgi:glycosyltransferase involved in cell wall biosynthesis